MRYNKDMKNKEFDLSVSDLGYKKTTDYVEDLIKNGADFCCDKIEEGPISLYYNRDCEPKVKDFYAAGITDTRLIAYFYSTLIHLENFDVYSTNSNYALEPLEKFSNKEFKKFKLLNKKYYKEVYKQMILRQEKAKTEEETL